MLVLLALFRKGGDVAARRGQVLAEEHVRRLRGDKGTHGQLIRDGFALAIQGEEQIALVETRLGVLRHGDVNPDGLGGIGLDGDGFACLQHHGNPLVEAAGCVGGPLVEIGKILHGEGLGCNLVAVGAFERGGNGD